MSIQGRLHKQKVVLLIAKARVGALKLEAQNAYKALGIAGRGGEKRVETWADEIIADLDKVILELAEDELDWQFADMRGDNPTKLAALEKKYAHMGRRIAELKAEEKETTNVTSITKAVR